MVMTRCPDSEGLFTDLIVVFMRWFYCLPKGGESTHFARERIKFINPLPERVSAEKTPINLPLFSRGIGNDVS
jgi:hypothetical protein